MTVDIQPGFLVLHSNQAELLGETVFEWIGRMPLAPMEEEIFLVQSNGVAEWLKMNLAQQRGICAATRVELPARFLWRSYRQVLGRDAVPAESPLDKLPLTWRLMHALPVLAGQPGFEPLAGFLQGGDMGRRLQLSQRLADLYDQYQVYRSDWLAAWAAGHDVLPAYLQTAPIQAAGSHAIPEDQRWQALLWRALLAPLDEAQQATARAQLHQRFLAALASPAAPATPLARRVVLFGMTHVPAQTLQALAALSTRCQVILAVPNPSRYHWADIIDGRELLRMERRRQPLRGNVDLANVPLQDMHAHGHPLLAAWGRQGRDFVRQLDAFDDAEASRRGFCGARIDLFDDAPGDTLLHQVQAAVRDLVPLAEHAQATVDASDRSIVFHIAHSAQREVEVLQDQLLALLAQAPPPGMAALQPREIVVMVPDIAAFAPAIRSVFGQYPRHDARFIPYDIADLNERGNNPMLVALEWLLRLPTQRCRLTEIRDLLDVPAVAARFGLAAQDLPQLTQWMEGAGIRWGLDAPHRDALGLAACGAQNSWMFGLRRMLLGYAQGDIPGGGSAEFDGIEPYAEVGGLDAALAGSLADLVDALGEWRELALSQATPAVWANRARTLLAAFFSPVDEKERLTHTAIEAALAPWLDACELAGFDEAVSLEVAREAWLDGIDAPGINRRFRAGGITFCTLLPMRAVPFEVVCLLGMNDGDYPRSSPRNDFDLMGLAGQRRPGDRSRRDDDRQLMLEALLSARRVLYVSWTGRSVRDNSEQPPSVLVSQLRDYLAAGWQGDASGELLGGLTQLHPLQPFSRRYFEEGDAALFTHAREWRAAHAAPEATAAAIDTSMPPAADAAPLTLAGLTSFLRNPVKDFFRHQLHVVFDHDDDTLSDDEAFAVEGLDEYSLLGEVLASGTAAVNDVPAQLARLQRAGRLPMAALGERTARRLEATLAPMLSQWQSLQSHYCEAADKLPLRFEHEGVVVDDWLDGLRQEAGGEDGGGQPVWLMLTPSRLCSDDDEPKAHPDKLIAAWVRTLVASACGFDVQGILVGKDAVVSVFAIDRTTAEPLLRELLDAWRDGMRAPLPLASKTALAQVTEQKPDLVYDGGQNEGENSEPCLARMYPDFEALTADGRFGPLADALYGPLARWVADHAQSQRHTGAELLAESEGA